MPQQNQESILSTQIRAQLNESLPAHEEFVTRREFFLRTLTAAPKKLLVGGAMLVESEVLLMPAIVREIQEREFARPKEERDRDDQKAADAVKDADFTHVSHTFPNGAIVLNKGVMHVMPVLKQRRFAESMRREMEAADIVLLESENVVNSATHVRVSHGFFAELRSVALELKKQVYDIDIKHRPIDPETLSAGIAAAAAIGIPASFVFGKIRKRTIPLRAFLRIVGWSAAVTSCASPQRLFFSNQEETGYPKSDLSWLVDGRTVLMLANIKSIAAQNPGKRIFVVTGDMHARGFEYYLKNPKQFDLRHAIYRNTYYSMFSGPPEKVTEISNFKSRVGKAGK